MTNRVEIIKNHKYIQYTALEQCLLSQYQLQHDSKIKLFIANANISATRSSNN